MQKDIMSQRNMLLIQDDPADAKAVRDVLDGSFPVEWVTACSKGLERLVREGKQEKQRPDGIEAVLVELFLPDSQGCALAR
jgi:hypothetical protein